MKYLAFLCALSLMVFAGCAAENGETEVVASTGGAIEVCDLISAADANKIFPDKEFFIDQELSSEADMLGQSICFISAVGETEAAFVQLSLVDSAVSEIPMSVEELFDSSRDLLESTTDISGLGTKAFRGPEDVLIGAGVHVYDAGRDVSFNLSASGGFGYEPTDEDFAAQEALAREILNRINSY